MDEPGHSSGGRPLPGRGYLQSTLPIRNFSPPFVLGAGLGIAAVVAVAWVAHQAERESVLAGLAG